MIFQIEKGSESLLFSLNVFKRYFSFHCCKNSGTGVCMRSALPTWVTRHHVTHAPLGWTQNVFPKYRAFNKVAVMKKYIFSYEKLGVNSLKRFK